MNTIQKNYYIYPLVIIVTIFIILSVFVVNVNADTLLTETSEFPVTQEIMDMTKDVAHNTDYPYYAAYSDSSGKFILFSNTPLVVYDGKITQGGGNIEKYKYNSSSNTYALVERCGYTSYTLNIPYDSSTIYYANLDIQNLNTSKVVFRTSLLRLPQTMVKGLTAKNLITMTLGGIKLLIASVVAFLVLAIAFRKGWTMLKRNLERA